MWGPERTFRMNKAGSDPIPSKPPGHPIQPGMVRSLSGLDLDADQLIPVQLLEPALQAKSLIIMPHGSLHLVPWAGLTFQGKRLFECCPVGILPNLSSCRAWRSNSQPLHMWPLLALPTTVRFEYNRCSRRRLRSRRSRDLPDVWRRHRPEIHGEGGNGSQLLRLAKHPDSPWSILHVSSHGTFEADEPMNSGLLFSDARFTPPKIARAGLRYDEVVLSVCSTGYRPTEVQGVVLSGDDILGLPGALLEAGVRSVLVSIPPAREDASQRFLSLYHEHRAEGTSPLVALQETQRTMLHGDYSPYHWIGFTVYGIGSSESGSNPSASLDREFEAETAPGGVERLHLEDGDRRSAPLVKKKQKRRPEMAIGERGSNILVSGANPLTEDTVQDLRRFVESSSLALGSF